MVQTTCGNMLDAVVIVKRLRLVYQRKISAVYVISDVIGSVGTCYSCCR